MFKILEATMNEKGLLRRFQISQSFNYRFLLDR